MLSTFEVGSRLAVGFDNSKLVLLARRLASALRRASRGNLVSLRVRLRSLIATEDRSDSPLAGLRIALDLGPSGCRLTQDHRICFSLFNPVFQGHPDFLGCCATGELRQDIKLRTQIFSDPDGERPKLTGTCGGSRWLLAHRASHLLGLVRPTT
ncbi:hypothetical protein AB0I91_13840 [Actinosynnema sp. NPDC049800]